MILFDLLFLGVVGGGACVVIFLVARLLLPVRAALLFAPIVAASGLMGVAGGFLLQVPFLPRTLRSGREVFTFLAICAVAGLCNAAFTGWLFVRVRRGLIARREGVRQAVAFD